MRRVKCFSRAPVNLESWTTASTSETPPHERRAISRMILAASAAVSVERVGTAVVLLLARRWPGLRRSGPRPGTCRLSSRSSPPRRLQPIGRGRGPRGGPRHRTCRPGRSGPCEGRGSARGDRCRSGHRPGTGRLSRSRKAAADQLRLVGRVQATRDMLHVKTELLDLVESGCEEAVDAGQQPLPKRDTNFCLVDGPEREVREDPGRAGVAAAKAAVSLGAASEMDAQAAVLQHRSTGSAPTLPGSRREQRGHK